MAQPEPEGHRHRHDQDDQLGRHPLHPTIWKEIPDPGHRHEDRQARDPDEGDRRIEPEEHLWQFAEDLERLGSSLLPEHHGKLLEDDDHADRGQHPVDDRCGEKLANHARPQKAEDHLHDPGRATHRQRQSIGLEVLRRVLPPCEPERLHRPQDDDDQTRCGPFDGEFGVADKGRQARADDGSEDTGDRRKTRGD